MSDDLNNLEYWRRRALATEEKLRLQNPSKPKIPKVLQIILLIIMYGSFLCVVYSTFRYLHQTSTDEPARRSD